MIPNEGVAGSHWAFIHFIYSKSLFFDAVIGLLVPDNIQDFGLVKIRCHIKSNAQRERKKYVFMMANDCEHHHGWR